ncbi:MAG: LacI family transcriptional regulator [Caldilineae bacterium]|nr:MAG: LacI family transcriptional regulator [Caldilineae bacterium]
MTVSIRTIAEKAGVSPSTVSRALRDDPRISEETRQLVQTLAQEMGYVPSQVARSLVLRRTHTLGVVVTTVADPYVSQVMSGIEQASQEAGFTVLLATSHGSAEQELHAIDTLRQREVDGLLVVSSRAGELYSSLLPRWEQPLVMINSPRQTGGNYYSVRTDTARGASLATDHLLALGHTRIAYIGGPPTGHSSVQRRAGYLAALRAGGAPIDHRLLLPGSGEADDGRRALPWLMDLGATGVVCYNDLTALGVLAAAWDAGMSVPEELSIVGIDNLAVGRLVRPQLTTVDQQASALGQEAVKLALAAIDGQQPEDVVLESQLVVRASTGEPHHP